MTAAFADRVIILTGASEGIGRALAIELARDAPRLVLAARQQERLDAVATDCRALGATVVTVATDVSEREACRALVDAAAAHFGRIDVLVNNAGSTMWSRFDALQDLSVLERLMAVNYLGAAWLTKFALPHLVKTRGLIVAVASVAGLTGVPERTAYAASKHAMIGFFDSLRIEIAPQGVAVTIVAPDFVVSEIHKRAIGADGRPLGATPMQEARIMSAPECARIVRRGMERRERLVFTSARGRFGRWLKLVAPRVIDGIAARAIRNKR